MEGDFYPRYQYPGIPTEEGIDFHAPDGIISIDGFQDEIFTVLQFADGSRTKEEVVNAAVESGLEVEVAEAVIDDLSQLNIITDSRNLYLALHEYTKNPTRFDQNLNAAQIREITSRPYTVEKDGTKHSLPSIGSMALNSLTKRESTRNFSELPLSLDHIGELLSAAYSLEIAPIPSAGGLYPLKVYALVKDGHEVPAGYYQYDPNEGCLIQFQDGISERGLQFIMNSDSLLYDAPVLFVIAADMSRHSEKYSNRGYRYTILEAGHAAQNIHTTSAELGLGSLEYGGFNDEMLKNELNLENQIEPLIVLGVGNKNEQPNLSDTMTTLAALDDSLVGPGKPVAHVSVDIFSNAAQELNFYHANAEYVKPNNSYSENASDRFTSGTATSMHLAQIKAIAEAYERYVSGVVRVDAEATASDLRSQWLNPETVRPVDDYQLQSYPQLTRFNDKQKIQWVKGSYLHDGTDVYVPIDLVYYPLTEKEVGRKLITLTDSSGVAAHTDRDIAVHKGLLELIERDAIMRNWFKRESMPRIDHNLLDDDVRKRVLHWHDRGYQTDFIDLTEENGDACIINVVIRNRTKKYPYFVNGAAADLNYGDTIQKAMQEAELGLAYALHSPDEKPLKQEQIHSPADHGIFYLHPENSDKIEWLWQGATTQQFKKIDNKAKIIDKYNPVVIDLAPQRAPLQVIRVIEPSLVPISFGFGSEYFTHVNSGVDTKKYRPDILHYFA